MRTKTVKRHYCDHCNKGMFKRPSMEKHEATCTLNPDRKCRLCVFVGEENQHKELMKIHKQDIEKYHSEHHGDDIFPGIIEIEKLGLGNISCPACILAVLRQSPDDKIWVNFDYKKEAATFWSQYNQDRRDQDDGYYA